MRAQHAAPTQPTIVATFRGIGLAALVAAIGAIITALSDIKGGQMAAYVPAAVLILRMAEGYFDKARGQKPQAGLLGSRPAPEAMP